MLMLVARVLGAVALLIGAGSVALARDPGAPASDGPRLALVIGNSKYTAISRLDNPANDARLVASVLKQLGFDVETHYDLDRRSFERAIDQFSERLKTSVTASGPEAVGLVYYAGHGVESGSTNYLLPIDADVRSDREVDWQAVSVEKMTKRVAEAGNQLNIFVLDACRNNVFRGVRSVGRRGLTPMGSVVGVYIASSTAAGDVASDGPGRNSPYTLALVESMVVPGYKLEDVFKSVRRKVRVATQESQIPWESSSLESDFYFVSGGRMDGPNANPRGLDVPLDGQALIVAIQSELVRTGCRSVSTTGEFDSQTVAGLRQFAVLSDHKFHWHRPTMAALRALKSSEANVCTSARGINRSRCLRVNGESFCE